MGLNFTSGFVLIEENFFVSLIFKICFSIKRNTGETVINLNLINRNDEYYFVFHEISRFSLHQFFSKTLRPEIIDYKYS